MTAAVLPIDRNEPPRGCRSPGTERIGIYADAALAIIEGTTYSCLRHLHDTLAAIEATGAVPSQIGVSLPATHRCGDVVSYVGGVR